MERFLALNFKHEGKASNVHNEVIRDLVVFINERYGATLNYDHIYSTIRRVPLSLSYRGKRYDIAFVLNGRRVLIQIDTDRLVKEDRGEGGSGG